MTRAVLGDAIALIRGTAIVSYKRSKNVCGSMEVFQGRTLTLSMLSMLRRCIGLPIEWLGFPLLHFTNVVSVKICRLL